MNVEKDRPVGEQFSPSDLDVENESPVTTDSEADGESRVSPSKRLKSWLIRYGPIGVFLFFLIKGLVWLAIIGLAWLGLRGD